MGKILIVDDEEKIRHIVRRMLESDGHDVMEADGGEECFKILKNDIPDLILMDVMMPEMDGWEVSRRIREDSAYKDVLISMLTVKSDDEDKIKSLDGAKAWHIAKPIRREKLLRTVKWLLQRPLDQ
ncbi:MAG: response regulator [Candidatus Hydrothermarchaeaceae archaeon]